MSTAPHPTRTTVSAGDVELVGDLYRPPAPAPDGPHPVVVMSHGFGAVKDQYLHRYARRLAEAGFVTLVYDHRGFGASGGTPRQDVDAWVQLRDMQHAISFARALPGVDPDRVGVWGTSFSGGHALVMGAIDPRVRAVVAQVPTISGSEAGRRRVPPHAVPAAVAAQVADREAVYAGAAPALRPLVDDDSGQPPVYAGPAAREFMDREDSRPESFVNAVTLQSLARTRDYEPGSYVPRISPTPLLMVVATEDDVAFTDLQLGAYAAAREPKELVLLRGDHFVAYEDAFDRACTAATTFFGRHLGGGATVNGPAPVPGATATTGRPVDQEALELVRRVCPDVHRIGGAWFFTPQAVAAGAALGVEDPFALYAAGRGGVVGDGDPAVVATTFAFFPPRVVVEKLRRATSSHPASQVARVYASGLATWGDDVFGDLEGAPRLTALARAVADAVTHPMGLPLFTGWRGVPPPRDSPGAALALALHVLRELRGDLHVHAAVAYRLSPAEAILGGDGPERARELFYPEPYPAPETYTARRRAAEDLTDLLCADAYAALGADERAEMPLLVDRAAHALTAWRGAPAGRG